MFSQGSKIYGPNNFEQLYDLDHKGNISFNDGVLTQNQSGILSDEENYITWSNGETWRKLTTFDGFWKTYDTSHGKYEVEGTA